MIGYRFKIPPIISQFTMAAWKYMNRRGKTRKTSKKNYSRRATRRAGAFGLYRSTSFRGLRKVARRYGSTVPRNLNPFPNSKLVRHKYVDTITMPSIAAAGLRAFYTMCANSVYDPDVSGTGHQPMFHDEMIAQYNNYTVLSSKIKVLVPAESTTASDWALWCDDDVSVPGDCNLAGEQHRVAFANKLDKRNNPLVLKGWYDAAKWNKTSRAGILSDDTQKVPKNNNPGNKAIKYFQIFTGPVDTSATQAAIKVRVVMTFITLWREPVDHTGS